MLKKLKVFFKKPQRESSQELKQQIPTHKYKTHIKLLKDVICYNQGELAQYSFLAGEKHKKIKEELRNSLIDKVKLSEYCKELNRFLDTQLENVCKRNFEFLRDYFNGRSKIIPRFCIKAHHKDLIVDIFRNNRKYDIVSYKIEANTGVFNVYRSGCCYFCNDIPSEVKIGRYFNPRLNTVRASAYVLPTEESKNDTIDKDWVRCWNDIQLKDGTCQLPPEDSCYKSTIIIPMTLLGNTLNPEFKTLFKIEEIEREKDRAIYGFLCFDNHKSNYFIEDIDVPIGYIFADILSLYLIERLRYTKYSKTFNSAFEKCNSQYPL